MQYFEILCSPAATLGHPQLRQTWEASFRPHWAQAEGTQGAPRKMRRQGAATPGATHRVSVGVAPSIRLPRQPRTAPLRRLPPHRSPWRRQFGARHPGSTAENAAAGRGNPGVHSPGVCGMCPQPPLAAEAAHRPAQALATCSPSALRRKIMVHREGSFVYYMVL